MRSARSARLCFGMLLVTLFSAWSFSAVQQTLAWKLPRDLPLSGVACDGTNCNILGVRLAAEGNRVHAIYGQSTSKQLFYSRGTTATDGTVTWERARVLAKNVTVQNVPSWDVVADANGTIHVAYYTNGRIRYTNNTQRGDVGAWSTPQGISSAARGGEVALTLDANGTPYAAWSSGIDKGNVVFAYLGSNNKWTVRATPLKTYFLKYVDIAVAGAGDSATVHVIADYEKRDDKNYAIYYVRGLRAGALSQTDLSSLSNSACPCVAPQVVVDPTTQAVYAGFVGGSIDNGYFWAFTRSQDNGNTWSSLTRMRANGTNLWADRTPMVAANNIVYFDLPVKKWTGSGISGWGSIDVRYNAASNSFTNPIDILNYEDTNGKLDRSTGYAINEVAKVAVWIRNYTDGLGYNSDPGGIVSAPPVDGKIALDGGATITSNPTLTIALTDVTGAPTQMRVAIDQPMSDAIPLEPFQASFTRIVTNLSVCSHTVAVALVTDQGVSTELPIQASITVDASVQASVLVGNPYKRSNAVIFSQTQDTNGGASDGDGQYTRVPAVYTEVNGADECSSLTQVSIGRTAGSYSSTQPIASNFYASPLSIPGAVAVGSNQVVLDVQDAVGNSQVYTRTISYDPNPPTLVTTGTLSVQLPTSGLTILTTLAFSGSVVTDDQYPNGYWGVWIANSRMPVTNPISDTSLVWSPIQRPSASQNFSLANWSVLSGLPLASQTPGDYYVYVRFLDGAGNPTSGVISATIKLDEITKPTVLLPVVVR